MKHPNAYTDDEQAFLDTLRREPTPIPVWAFERLTELLGRVPSYALIEGSTGYDYDRPITLNQRFQDSQLAAQGVENIMLAGRVYVLEAERVHYTDPKLWERVE